jgi:hypothetical protein
MTTDSKEALLTDLDLQWRDHFHMRDQTWKTLTNSLLLFLGVVGLELKGLGPDVMIPAYLVVLVTAFFGVCVATHHRFRQSQKFEIIKLCEKELGIAEYKQEILDKNGGIAEKIFTAGFIELAHFCVGVVAVVLLVKAAA